MMVTELPKDSTVRLDPPIHVELDEAPLLPVPIDTTRFGIIPRPKRGQTRTAPDTVIVFRDRPRADPAKAFAFLEATVDSAQVRILGAEIDCVFRAPVYGERLIITADRNGCDAYIEGHPIARQVFVPKEQIEEDQGFFGKLSDLIGKIALVLGLLIAGMVILEVFRMFRSNR
jgi:hypothetical protein